MLIVYMSSVRFPLLSEKYRRLLPAGMEIYFFSHRTHMIGGNKPLIVLLMKMFVQISDHNLVKVHLAPTQSWTEQGDACWERKRESRQENRKRWRNEF